jgi:hypothetical protein
MSRNKAIFNEKIGDNVYVTVFENGDVYVSTDGDVHVVRANKTFTESVKVKLVEDTPVVW